jgi:ATP-dependent phosphofructokinase / diphosphate-dependent phosphofructokinase
MSTNNTKGTIGILTGGGDVPGLNPAIRAITIKALHEGYRVIGLRRGWSGLVDLIRDKDADNTDNYIELTHEIVNKAGRTGGTFLHTSRTNPGRVPKEEVPGQYADKYNKQVNDLTEDVIKSINYLGIDYLIPIGGDDSLRYSMVLYSKGIKIIGIPKTMDNDVPGTDYCIGFSTCITRTINIINSIRTSAGSHERLMLLEVFGRYAGFTAMLPTLAGAANRCAIPEYKFDVEQLTELLLHDREKNPSKYAVSLISQGATFNNIDKVIPENTEKDDFGNPKLSGIGEIVSKKIEELSPKYNNGKKVNVINQSLGYMVRSGDPDTVDSIVPMAYGNIALDLILKRVHGRLVVLKNGRYDNVPLDLVTGERKTVDVHRFYDTERLRPQYKSFEFSPLFIMTGE